MAAFNLSRTIQPPRIKWMQKLLVVRHSDYNRWRTCQHRLNSKLEPRTTCRARHFIRRTTGTIPRLNFLHCHEVPNNEGTKVCQSIHSLGLSNLERKFATAGRTGNWPWCGQLRSAHRGVVFDWHTDAGASYQLIVIITLWCAWCMHNDMHDHDQLIIIGEFIWVIVNIQSRSAHHSLHTDAGDH